MEVEVRKLSEKLLKELLVVVMAVVVVGLV